MNVLRSIALEVAAALPSALIWGWVSGSWVLFRFLIVMGVSMGVTRAIASQRPLFVDRLYATTLGSTAAALFHLYRVVRGI